MELIIEGLHVVLNNIVDLAILVLCQDLVQVKMRNFSPF